MPCTGQHYDCTPTQQHACTWVLIKEAKEPFLASGLEQGKRRALGAWDAPCAPAAEGEEALLLLMKAHQRCPALVPQLARPPPAPKLPLSLQAQQQLLAPPRAAPPPEHARSRQPSLVRRTTSPARHLSGALQPSSAATLPGSHGVAHEGATWLWLWLLLVAVHWSFALPAGARARSEATSFLSSLHSS
jgi:hypothetical protein